MPIGTGARCVYSIGVNAGISFPVPFADASVFRGNQVEERDAMALSASAATVSISPRVPTWMGCGPAGEVCPDRASNLEANLLLLRDDGSNSQVLLVSVDALYPGPRLRRELENRLSAFLDARSIFLGASHTHAAPNLDETKPLLGRVVEEHLSFVSSKIAEAAESLLEDTNWVPVEPRLFAFGSKSTVNRRRRVLVSIRNRKLAFGTAEMLPNQRAEPNVSSEVLEFVSNGVVFATIWIFPCHPLASPDASKISPDFVGDVRDHYRLGHGVAPQPTPFLFFQGASGDRRPPTSRKRSSTSTLNLLINWLYGPTFQRFRPDEYKKWLAKLLQEFDGRTPIAPPLPRRGGYLAIIRSAEPLKKFFRVADPTRHFTVHIINLGGFRIIGVSAEPTWKFREELFENFPERAAFTSLVGCIDDTYGYLVTAKEFAHGGYEATGFMRYFSIQPLSRKHTGRQMAQLILTSLFPRPQGQGGHGEDNTRNRTGH